MRGFLALEPDDATLAGLVARQNRLRDGLARQGVSFADRLNAPLVVWPFARVNELDEAFRRLSPCAFSSSLGPLRGGPNDDRPGEIGHALEGTEPFQGKIWEELRELLDPDPPKPPFVRLVRVSPPSRKVGHTLRSIGLLGTGSGRFIAESLGIWTQTPQGFEIYRRMRLGHGGT